MAWFILLSPCASGARYVVGAEVARHFERSCRPAAGGGYLFDLPGEIRRRLVEEGVPSEAVEVSGVCSISDDRCHSFRRDGEGAGRMAAFIGMREER